MDLRFFSISMRIVNNCSRKNNKKIKERRQNEIKLSNCAKAQIAETEQLRMLGRLNDKFNRSIVN